ncbi:hypothetical protein [Mycobacterium colombiense]|nr:hypothetical protein [Mycobacterium colombiense]
MCAGLTPPRIALVNRRDLNVCVLRPLLTSTVFFHAWLITRSAPEY